MTPQESSMLNDLIGKIQQTQLPEKDAEAEEFLQQRLGSNPDALYILAQTVLVQNIALDRAKAQLQQLQQQVQAPQPAHTSFLGSLLGRHDAPPPPAYPQRAADASSAVLSAGTCVSSGLFCGASAAEWGIEFSALGSDDCGGRGGGCFGV